MSHYCDETYDVYSEQRVRARKPHDCDACRETIPRGVTYWRVSWVFDGSVGSVKRCERCQAIHVHLRDLGEDHEMWPDERLACGLDYVDEWGEMPPEIAALAFALPSDVLDAPEQ